MRLLVICQRVDWADSNLGFFQGWLEKMSRHLDGLVVICLSGGKHHLPSNVKVFSLGKEGGASKIRQFFHLQKLLFKYARKTDGVFVHMCPLYAILTWPLAKTFRKRIILWYVHRSTDWKLRLASKLVDKILTASERSCRLKNRRKIKVVGHGINIDKFKIEPRRSASLALGTLRGRNEKFKILTAGRISKSKNLDVLIKAVDVLANEKKFQNFELLIAGESVDKEGRGYKQKLLEMLKSRGLIDYVHFVGSVPHQEMPQYYQSAALFVNLSSTGSIDKAVLEAMACGCLVITSNEAFAALLPKKYLISSSPGALADKIIEFKNSPPQDDLRQIVVENHSLDKLINKIIQCF